MSEALTSSGRVPFPPVVYLPVSAVPEPGGDPEIELRQMSDGRRALLTYSALDRLVNLCGPDQPWVVLATDKLEEIDRWARFDVVLLDVEIPAEHRHQGAG
ncbi:SAV_915 family protein [Herbihabitans rhizosphaerae]|uniref:SAV_915 family protein n=1 Tax=Herbihabitans rhizosphaerae TaxID=1872711 RepID=UPI0030FF0236